jgi:hypothetical protein
MRRVFGIAPLLFPQQVIRKVAGVQVTAGKGNGRLKGPELKQRVLLRCLDLGIDVKNDDEGDAALLLIAGGSLVTEIPRRNL